VLNERPGVAWTVAALAYLLVILWGGTHALRTLWGVALLGALLALGLVALRRQTLREFPAPLPPPAGPAGGNGAPTAPLAAPLDATGSRPPAGTSG
jgi:hypothetical protein